MNRCLLFLLLVFTVPASAQSYKTIHDKAIVVDTHNDIISTCLEKGYRFDSDLKGKTHSDLKRMFQGGLDAQMFSIYCDGTQEQPFAFANREIDTLYAWVKRNPDSMMLVTSPEELKAAVQQHKLAAMIGVEGGHMIEDDLHKLEALYKRGARYLTLTWNNSNNWATSAEDETDTSKKLEHKGLTDFGRTVVQKMNALGMMVDVSHVGEQTFWDVIATSNKPVIASHSSVYALAPVFRNLKDDQIRAIAKNGGVIQLNFYPVFLDSTAGSKQRTFFRRHKSERDSLRASGMSDFAIQQWLFSHYADEAKQMQPPLSLLIDHIDHIVRLVGADYVGLGGDFDGITTTPAELTDVTKYPLITKALLERGYKKKEVEKILGGNFIRVFKANQPH
jgi:membrane dipeptidase